MNKVQELRWRRLLYQTTLRDDQLLEWLDKPRMIFWSVDPWADSLDTGDLTAMLILKRYRDAGHSVSICLGDATAVIGDPLAQISGSPVDRDTVQTNCALIRKQIEFILGDVTIYNNSTWLNELRVLDFLRNMGKHVSLQNVLSKNPSNLTYMQLSYSLLRAYDFANLNRFRSMEMQIGNKHQWSYMRLGQELCQNMNRAIVHCGSYDMPKMEPVWLSGHRTYPYHFYQHWLNVDDQHTEKCLKMLTDVPKDEIEFLEGQDRRRRFSQKVLATELTKLVHGQKGLEIAEAATRVFFGEDLNDLSEGMLYMVFQGMPQINQSRKLLEGDGMPVIDAFVAAGLCKTKGEARRMVQQGGAYVNNVRAQETTFLTFGNLVTQTAVVLRSGKKNYAVLWFK